MSFPWKLVRIGNVAEVKGGKRLPKGQQLQINDNGAPYIRITDWSDGVIDCAGLLYVPESAQDAIERYRIRSGDIFISIVGTVGLISEIPDSLDGAFLTENAAKICITSGDLDSSFLKYVLSSDYGQNAIAEQTVGSTQPKLALQRIKEILVPIPSLRQQQAIAEVLGALDGKIAVNTKLAATADGYIRASLAHLTANIDDVITIEKLVISSRDLTDPNSLDPNVSYVGLEHIPRRSMWLSDAGTADAVTSTKACFQRGDILFGKLRPYFHKVVAAPFAGVCSTDILVLTPLFEGLSGFVLASVASDLVVERVTAASEGTRMPRTSWRDLSAVEVPWPGEEKARSFSIFTSALRESIEGLLRENINLSATRDALLPQLMSGKLRVKDAEELVAAAV